jgi:hypothetical protein
MHCLVGLGLPLKGVLCTAANSHACCAPSCCSFRTSAPCHHSIRPKQIVKLLMEGQRLALPPLESLPGPDTASFSGGCE